MSVMDMDTPPMNPALCMELAFEGEAPLVYGPIDELAELVHAMLGPSPSVASTSALRFSLSRRPLASPSPVADAN